MTPKIEMIIGIVLAAGGIFIEKTYPIGYKGFVFSIGLLGLSLLILGLAVFSRGIYQVGDDRIWEEIW